MLFNVLKERHVFFSGLVWKPHLCVMELIEGGNLWSLTIQTEESFNAGQNPDEVFLLQSIEQIIIGEADSSAEEQKLMFVKFMFRRG